MSGGSIQPIHYTSRCKNLGMWGVQFAKCQSQGHHITLANAGIARASISFNCCQATRQCTKEIPMPPIYKRHGSQAVCLTTLAKVVKKGCDKTIQQNRRANDCIRNHVPNNPWPQIRKLHAPTIRIIPCIETQNPHDIHTWVLWACNIQKRSNLPSPWLALHRSREHNLNLTPARPLARLALQFCTRLRSAPAPDQQAQSAGSKIWQGQRGNKKQNAKKLTARGQSGYLIPCFQETQGAGGTHAHSFDKRCA